MDSKTICLSVLLPLFMVSFVCAAVPDIISRQRNTIVTVYIDDANKNHVESGNGFIVDRDGMIVTNCRVIARWIKEIKSTLNVEMEGGITFPVEELISSKCENNLALLKIKTEGLPAVKLAKNYNPRPGEKVSVIRNLPESAASVLNGVVQGVNLKNGSFQISQRMAPASSGSPVFNVKGEVIGAVIVQSVKGKNFNLAVTVKDIVKQLAKYTKPKRAAESGVRSPETRKNAATDEERADAPRFYFSRGTGFDQSKMYHEAIDAYEQSLKINPDFVDAYINLGIDYYELGEYEKAISAFKQAIRIKPDLLSAYDKLGAAYIICGEYSKAVDTFKKIIEIDPNNVSAHFNLGITYFLKGDVFDAQEECLILENVDKERAGRLFDLIN